MSLRDALRTLIGTNPTYRNVTFSDATVSAVLGMSAEQLWRTQPHLRTVVSFVARNIAQLGLHTFERVSETDRRRVRDDTVALTLARPNATMTAHELIYGLVADFKLYDVAVWLVHPSAEARSGWEILPIPPAWVTATGGGSMWAPEWVDVQRPGRAAVRIDAKELLIFHGWNPGDPATGSSPVDALRGVLAEQIHANAYRQQVWQRGGRVGTVLSRPAGGPAWSDGARERFARDWKSKWTGNEGPKAGGTPILEDGMTLSRVGFSAKEDEWIEGAKLSLSTVASVYHINPTMVGVLDNANFSNVREFRRMLYGDSLGPDLAMIEDRLNTFLVPRLTDRTDVYVEFNIGEKMQGSFEEQTAALQASIGRPWMTADEGRALLNMPSLGGDAEQLVTPLNVLVGGQSSPTDGVTAGGGGTLDLPGVDEADDIKRRVEAAAALIRSGFDPGGALAAVGLDPIAHLGLLPVTVQRPQEPEQVDQEAVDDLKGAGVQVKARAPQSYEDKAAQVLKAFFRRQREVVLKALRSKAGEDWWATKRWDEELSTDLYALALSTASEVGQTTAKALGFTPGDYDAARTEAFLKEVAATRAELVNATTRDQIRAALDANPEDYPEGEAPTPAHVYDVAEEARAPQAATALVTMFSAFAVHEAASQMAGERATKTWVTGTNPRPSHAAMNGQTVRLSQDFSNGLAWPGAAGASADETAGCNCSLDISVS